MQSIPNDDFYEKFEREFRGGREEIIERLRVYKPYLEPILQTSNRKLIDLGCGRGEWLELAQSWGFEAVGYDLDEGMLSHCQKLGLNAHHSDIIRALKDHRDGSVSVVSAFHLIEHLKFDDIRNLFRECLRILTPGGLVIIETPNTEHPLVMAETFWLDPTHIHPLPPGLLSFMARYQGFGLNTIVRLNGRKTEAIGNETKLFDVFHSVSPDVALIAVKEKNDAYNEIVKELFRTPKGHDLDYFVNKFDEKIRGDREGLNLRIAELQAKLDLFEQSIVRLILRNILRSVKRRIKNATLILSSDNLINKFVYFLNYIRKKPKLFKFIRKIISYVPFFERRLLRLVKSKMFSGLNKEHSLFDAKLDNVVMYHSEYVSKNKFSDERSEHYYNKLSK
jgi:O-antigen chain-terminating methyltransferase